MDGAPRDRRTIVCGVDDSVEAREALRTAATLSKQIDARIVLVHVAPRQTVPGASVAPSIKEMLWRADTGRGEELLAAVVAEERLISEVERRVLFGSPPLELAEVARKENADFLVVGCRGRGPVKSALLGSVSASLPREAPCPVVVVCGHGPALDGNSRDAS